MAFWKSRFAFNLPDKAEHGDNFRKERIDEPTYRQMKQTCDSVLQKGPNGRGRAEREWAVAKLAQFKP